MQKIKLSIIMPLRNSLVPPDLKNDIAELEKLEPDKIIRAFVG